MIEPAEVPTMTSALRGSQPVSRSSALRLPASHELADDPAGPQHEPDLHDERAS